MQDKKNELEHIELQLFLEGIYRHYGHDFRNYAMSSFRRRVLKFVREESLVTISGLLERILHDEACMERFLLSISVHVTEMFRDPVFFKTIREKVVGRLSKESFFKVWHAGCSSGEEVYSMAILLKEHDLLNKCKIYATDISQPILERAQSSIFNLRKMQDYTENYIKSGGKRPFSEYYTVKYHNAIFKHELKKNIVWGHHNLVTDSSFNEFQIILCRNVLIYFNRQLQERVHRLFYDSLEVGGVLALGHKESIAFTPYEDCYEVLDSQNKLYLKKK
ncbi:MAG TPA: protein-glutamate O-methyltransferase CheR [Patescibacteria group bacterium]|nr:protein-glutamate O-methyltransferase CheR [Patescibacteria group bacterium]